MTQVGSCLLCGHALVDHEQTSVEKALLALLQLPWLAAGEQSGDHKQSEEEDEEGESEEEEAADGGEGPGGAESDEGSEDESEDRPEAEAQAHAQGMPTRDAATDVAPGDCALLAKED